jgi:hypothetical protein
MIDDEFEFCFELMLSCSHACKTPPVEDAGAGSLPVPYSGGAKKKKKEPP